MSAFSSSAAWSQPASQALSLPRSLSSSASLLPTRTHHLQTAFDLADNEGSAVVLALVVLPYPPSVTFLLHPEALSQNSTVSFTVVSNLSAAFVDGVMFEALAGDSQFPCKSQVVAVEGGSSSPATADFACSGLPSGVYRCNMRVLVVATEHK